MSNLAGNSALEPGLNAQMQRAIRDELREPLPTRLYSAHKRGLLDYFNTAGKAALKATERRRERAERETEEEAPFGEEPGLRLTQDQTGATASTPDGEGPRREGPGD